MRITRLVAGLVVAAGLVAAKPARFVEVAHPLVGKWNVEYERGRQNMNGEINILTGKAMLEIEEKGDSLIATLTPAPSTDGRPTPQPSRMAGVAAGNAATFKWTSQSRVNLNGEERVLNITNTWELKAEGDNLSGTSARVMADMPAMATPAPVKGTRVR